MNKFFAKLFKTFRLNIYFMMCVFYQEKKCLFSVLCDRFQQTQTKFNPNLDDELWFSIRCVCVCLCYCEFRQHYRNHKQTTDWKYNTVYLHSDEVWFSVKYIKQINYLAPIEHKLFFCLDSASFCLTTIYLHFKFVRIESIGKISQRGNIVRHIQMKPIESDFDSVCLIMWRF